MFDLGFEYKVELYSADVNRNWASRELITEPEIMLFEVVSYLLSIGADECEGLRAEIFRSLLSACKFGMQCSKCK